MMKVPAHLKPHQIDERAAHFHAMMCLPGARGFRQPNPYLERLTGGVEPDDFSFRAKKKLAVKRAHLEDARENPVHKMTRNQRKAHRRELKRVLKLAA